MKMRYTLAVALLLSTVPHLSFSNDYTSCRSDLAYSGDCRVNLQRLDANDTDIEVALAYILSKEIPDRYNCSFDLKARIQKVAVKYFLNRFLLHNSLNIVADLPSTGQLEVLTTDQALEIALVVAEDVLAHKAAAGILTDAGRVYLREKIVSVVLWLLTQTNVEALLPDQLTESGVYNEARNEVARYFVDKAIDKVAK